MPTPFFNKKNDKKHKPIESVKQPDLEKLKDHPLRQPDIAPLDLNTFDDQAMIKKLTELMKTSNHTSLSYAGRLEESKSALIDMVNATQTAKVDGVKKNINTLYNQWLSLMKDETMNFSNNPFINAVNQSDDSVKQYIKNTLEGKRGYREIRIVPECLQDEKDKNSYSHLVQSANNAETILRNKNNQQDMVISSSSQTLTVYRYMPDSSNIVSFDYQIKNNKIYFPATSKDREQQEITSITEHTNSMATSKIEAMLHSEDKLRCHSNLNQSLSSKEVTQLLADKKTGEILIHSLQNNGGFSLSVSSKMPDGGITTQHYAVAHGVITSPNTKKSVTSISDDIKDHLTDLLKKEFDVWKEKINAIIKYHYGKNDARDNSDKKIAVNSLNSALIKIEEKILARKMPDMKDAKSLLEHHLQEVKKEADQRHDAQFIKIKAKSTTSELAEKAIAVMSQKKS